jgi:hypothetical protein
VRKLGIFWLTAFVALQLLLESPQAEMGPCRPERGWITCGNGDGAARIVEKTISPSGRLAFAWRLTDRPPSETPAEIDPKLENLIVRIEDGAVVTKSHSLYWDLGSKIAKAFLFTAWSSDSRLLIKVEQRGANASAELFSFDQNDRALGPVELVGAIKPAVLSQMKSTNDAARYGLVFSSHPAMTIDNQGLIHLHVQAIEEDGPDIPVYELTLQVSDEVNSLNAMVNSIAPYPKASIFITVH